MHRLSAMILTFCALASCGFAVRSADAAACSVALGSGAVTMIPAQPIERTLTRIYVTVDPECARDVEGTVSYTANGAPLGAKPFSYKSMGEAEEVWIAWTPTAAGAATIGIEVTGSDPGELDPATFTTSIVVDRDTDHDGTGDATDADDDDDGASDANDDAPQNPNIRTDTDRDDSDDAVDSDDDNDGLYDFEEEKIGSDPLKTDSDGDGVVDKEDAFPKDSGRTAPDPTPTPKVLDESEQNTTAPRTAASEPVPLVPGTEVPDAATTSTSSGQAPQVLSVSEPDSPSESEVVPSSRARKIPWLWILAVGLFAMGFWFLLKDKKRRRV